MGLEQCQSWEWRFKAAGDTASTEHKILNNRGTQLVFRLISGCMWLSYPGPSKSWSSVKEPLLSRFKGIAMWTSCMLNAFCTVSHSILTKILQCTNWCSIIISHSFNFYSYYNYYSWQKKSSFLPEVSPQTYTDSQKESLLTDRKGKYWCVLCSFPIAIATNYLQRSSLNETNVLFYNSGGYGLTQAWLGWNPGVRRAAVLLEALGETRFSCLFQQLEAACISSSVQYWKAFLSCYVQLLKIPH